MARAADVELSIDDFQHIGDKTPFLADLKYASLVKHHVERVLKMNDFVCQTVW